MPDVPDTLAPGSDLESVGLVPDVPESSHDAETSHWLTGQVLAREDARVSWALADWLVIGKQYDSAFKKSALVTGYSLPHLWNLWRVATAFPEGARDRVLSLAAHREILREPQPERWPEILAAAVAHEWTSRDIITYINTYGSKPRTPSPTTHPGYQHVHVECPACHHQFPIRGHKVKTDAP